MTIDELRSALAESLTRGTLGKPVALRISLQYADAKCPLRDGTAIGLTIAETVFGNRIPHRLLAQRHKDSSQLSVLASYKEGQTLSITIGSGSALRPTLDLILVGNRGIVRLEGGELYEPNLRPPLSVDMNNFWGNIELSLKERAAVSINA